MRAPGSDEMNDLRAPANGQNVCRRRPRWWSREQQSGEQNDRSRAHGERQGTGYFFACVFAGFEGESYADIPTVKRTVGLMPLETRFRGCPQSRTTVSPLTKRN